MHPLALDQNKDYIFLLSLNGLALVIFRVLYAFAKPDITSHRLLAFFVSLTDAFVLFRRTGLNAPFFVILPPLALIWFAEMLGALRGNVGHGGGVINTDTPEWMVAGFGWIVLLVVSWFIFNGFDSRPWIVWPNRPRVIHVQ